MIRCSNVFYRNTAKIAYRSEIYGRAIISTNTNLEMKAMSNLVYNIRLIYK